MYKDDLDAAYAQIDALKGRIAEYEAKEKEEEEDKKIVKGIKKHLFRKKIKNAYNKIIVPLTGILIIGILICCSYLIVNCVNNIGQIEIAYNQTMAKKVVKLKHPRAYNIVCEKTRAFPIRCLYLEKDGDGYQTRNSDSISRLEFQWVKKDNK
jgi:hypothetical protein